jgi:hypothetical protein
LPTLAAACWQVVCKIALPAMPILQYGGCCVLIQILNVALYRFWDWIALSL